MDRVGQEETEPSAFSFSTEGRGLISLSSPLSPRGREMPLCTYPEPPPNPLTTFFLLFPIPRPRESSLSPLKFETKSAHFSPHFPVGLL